MPRIEADTVAEHRARQHEALLEAAEAVLVERGHEGLTFAALGERTGLARNSVYRYFSSREDIVAQVLERPLPGWLERLRGAMARADDLDGRVAAFVGAQLALVSGVRPELAGALAQSSFSPELRSRISAMTFQPAALLEEALVAAGHPHAAVTAQLVQGIVNAAIRVLHQSGTPLDDVTAIAVATAQRAVEAR
jgi:AcrR family transcriptional regulator